MELELEKFFEKFFENNCNCTEKECSIGPNNAYKLGINKLRHIDELCNVITYPLKETTVQNYTNTIEPRLQNISYLKWSLNLYQTLIENKILHVKNNIVYLFNGKQFTWENIQGLSENVNVNVNVQKSTIDEILRFFYHTTDVDISHFIRAIKILFWYFRKSIVDNIIKDTIINFKLNVLAISVGSTNITSDYDITLYSPNVNHISFCIRVFQGTFNKMFNVDSSSVFDTNVYGSAFIQFTTGSRHAPKINDTNDTNDDTDKTNKNVMTRPFHTMIVCNKRRFYYTNFDESIIDSQRVFAVLKLIKFIEPNLTKTLDSIHVKMAIKLQKFLDRRKERMEYSEIVDLLSEYTHKTLELYTLFVSLVNYFGHETYFTRGAFIDVVVNTQICGGKGVPLDESALIDSFIENYADFIHSHNIKYLNRALGSCPTVIKQEFKSLHTASLDCVNKKCNDLYIQQGFVKLVSKILTIGTTGRLDAFLEIKKRLE